MSKSDKLTLAHLLRGKRGVHSARMFAASRHAPPRERAAVVEELASLAEKALQFERPKGSRNKHSLAVQRHVENIVRENQQATREELYQLADRKVIGLMPRATFLRYVGAARKKLGIRARPGRRR